MHELGLMQNIVDTIQDHARANSVQKVMKVMLEVGKVSGVVPESLEFCFEICTKDTPLEGAELDIQSVAAVARCKGCGQEFDLVENDFSCPACEDSEWEMISGKELIIKGLEVI
jgi:hydrogenase nickel incorporation protein HypA/HybF